MTGGERQVEEPINIQDYRIKIQYDGKLTIAIGKSRKDTRWKNKEFTWLQLLTKLSKTYRTRETVTEYKQLGKARQDEIKDIGGFVGGSLKDGHRKADSVICRQLLTLDADFAPVGLWEDIEMLQDFAVACYSTHKHTPEKPRLRLVIPLNREVTPEEYEAIGRRIAADIGIDFFDDTTYQASRLMYWPSTPLDGEYFFKIIDEPWLDADKVLATYKDWKDSSFWPESNRVINARKKLADRQGDPCEKDGLIGAFCRAYDIHEAIETFLSEEYVHCGMPDRYTYTKGSTSAGLVIYEEGKFAYSNHATDPASGKLCNAFDLVRLHKYGELDVEAAADASTNKLPSYRAMMEFIQKDKKTKVEAIEGAKDDFLDADLDGVTDWMGYLVVNGRGNIESTIANITLILRKDERIKGAFGENELSHRPELKRDLPWRDCKRGIVWKNSDDSGLRAWMESEYKISGIEKIMDAFTNVCTENSFHPIKKYLNSLEWDGVERLDTLLIDYLGAQDTEYVRAVTRKMFAAAVARIYRPGTKFDNMLIITGAQGIGKSTLLSKMGKAWFSDSIEELKGKDTTEGLLGRWIIEISELDAMKKSEVETIKKFLSKTTDIFRIAYGRRSDEYKRQCVFFGTTNSDDFLKDRTGNRRFWPVDTKHGIIIKDVFKDLDNEVDLLWAEAKARYEAGEELFLSGELAKAAEAEQEAHMEVDPRIGQIEEYLEMKLPSEWRSMSLQARRDYIHNNQFGEPESYIIRDNVCALEIWCELFKGDLTSKSAYDVKVINGLLKSIEGWEYSEKTIKFGGLYGVQRGFRRVVTK